MVMVIVRSARVIGTKTLTRWACRRLSVPPARPPGSRVAEWRCPGERPRVSTSRLAAAAQHFPAADHSARLRAGWSARWSRRRPCLPGTPRNQAWVWVRMRRGASASSSIRGVVSSEAMSIAACGCQMTCPQTVCCPGFRRKGTDATRHHIAGASARADDHGHSRHDRHSKDSPLAWPYERPLGRARNGRDTRGGETLVAFAVIAHRHHVRHCRRHPYGPQLLRHHRAA